MWKQATNDTDWQFKLNLTIFLNVQKYLGKLFWKSCAKYLLIIGVICLEVSKFKNISKLKQKETRSSNMLLISHSENDRNDS